MNKKSEMNKHDLIKTTFNCPLALRDKLEKLINENSDKYSPDKIMEMLLTKALSNKNPLS